MAKKYTCKCLSMPGLCCPEMTKLTGDCQIPITYSPAWREYFLVLKKSKGKILISYCPWYDTKLPSSLKDIYFNTLSKEYKIDSPDYDDKNFPHDFKSNEWWKIRGL